MVPPEESDFQVKLSSPIHEGALRIEMYTPKIRMYTARIRHVIPDNG